VLIMTASFLVPWLFVSTQLTVPLEGNGTITYRARRELGNSVFAEDCSFKWCLSVAAGLVEWPEKSDDADNAPFIGLLGLTCCIAGVASS
jgi:hypothetical protein